MSEIETAWDLLGLANDIERGRTPHRDDVAQALRETHAELASAKRWKAAWKRRAKAMRSTAPGLRRLNANLSVELARAYATCADLRAELQRAYATCADLKAEVVTAHDAMLAAAELVEEGREGFENAALEPCWCGTPDESGCPQCDTATSASDDLRKAYALLIGTGPQPGELAPLRAEVCRLVEREPDAVAVARRQAEEIDALKAELVAKSERIGALEDELNGRDAIDSEAEKNAAFWYAALTNEDGERARMLAALKEDGANLRAEVVRLTERVEVQNAAILLSGDEVAGLRAQLAAKDASIRALHEVCDERDATVAALTKERDAHARDADNLAESIAALQKRAEEAEAQLEEISDRAFERDLK